MSDTFEILLEKARFLLTTKPAVTTMMLQEEFKIEYSPAHRIIERLQAEGRIGKYWNQNMKGYRVLPQEGKRN